MSERCFGTIFSLENRYLIIMFSPRALFLEGDTATKGAMAFDAAGKLEPWCYPALEVTVDLHCKTVCFSQLFFTNDSLFFCSNL
jgi:hypothetical protein